MLLAKYPDDTIGLGYLAIVYCLAEDYERCAELRERAARLSPSYLGANNLAVV
jgi:hypothetical protein